MRDKFIIGLAVLCGILLTSCGGKNASDYVAQYNLAEKAYMGDDLNEAEIVLIGFSKYLESGSPDGMSEAYERALFITQLRLYDIYAHKGELDKADELMALLKASKIHESGMASESEIKDFLSSLQSEERFVPLWKKSR